MKIRLRYNSHSINPVTKFANLRIGFDYLKEIINKRINTIKGLRKMINVEMTDEEFCKTAMDLYNIEVAGQDLLEISADILESEVSKKFLKTTLTYKENQVTVKSADCCFLEAEIVVPNNFNIDLSHQYEAFELKKLIEDKKIVLLNLYSGEKVNNMINQNDKENLQNLKIFNNLRLSNLNSSNNCNNSALSKFLKNVLTESKLKSDLNEVTENTIEGLSALRTGALNNKLNYETITLFYNEIIEVCNMSETLKREKK